MRGEPKRKEITATIDHLSFCLAIVIIRHKESDNSQFSAQILSDEVNGYAWGDTANFSVSMVALSHSFTIFRKFLGIISVEIISMQGDQYNTPAFRDLSERKRRNYHAKFLSTHETNEWSNPIMASSEVEYKEVLIARIHDLRQLIYCKNIF